MMTQSLNFDGKFGLQRLIDSRDCGIKLYGMEKNYCRF
jgi:hypothetical protein